MVLYVYNSKMELQGILEKITSLVWTRKYWECGEFKLLVPFTEDHNRLLQTGNIILKHGDSEAAEIQYISISKNIEGFEEIEVQGKLLTHWLSKRVIAKQMVNISDTAQNLIYRLVDENCINTTTSRQLPNFSIDRGELISGSALTYNSEEYDNLLDSVVDLAQGSKIGFKVLTDRALGTHTFCVYKGMDCTADNTLGNPPCIFSPDYDNVLEQEYTKSVEKHKNTAYITGEEPNPDETDKQRVLLLLNDEYTGLSRNEVYIDAGDIKQNYKDDNDVEISLTDEDYAKALTARGNEKLEQFAISQSFSSDINTRANLKYRVDFDLGDRVTCINRTWNVQINARITEISEVYEVEGETLEITFGESIPSIYKQIKTMQKAR